MNSQLKKILPFLPLVLIAVLAVGQLRADSLNLGLLTAEAPSGWTAAPVEGAYVVFGPGEKVSMTITFAEYAYPDPRVMAGRLAADYAVKALDDEAGFIFFQDRDFRFWRGLSAGGQSLEISVHGTDEHLAALLSGLKIPLSGRDDAALSEQLEFLLGKLKKDEVISWLTGQTPPFAEPPAFGSENLEGYDPEGAKDWSGRGLSARVPKSWTVTEEEGRIRFASPDQAEFLIVKTLPAVKPALGREALARRQQEIHQLGGVNLRSAEGRIFFDLPDLSGGEMFDGESESIVLIRQGGGPELEALQWSLFE